MAGTAEDRLQLRGIRAVPRGGVALHAHLLHHAHDSGAAGTGSRKISITPPHTAGLNDAIASVSSTFTMRGVPLAITSRAASSTSASPQPPPIVPISPFSRSISILLPAWRGTEPRVEITVASAALRPAAAASSNAAQTS